MKHKIGMGMMVLGAVLVLCAAGFVVHNQKEDEDSGKAASIVLVEYQQVQEDLLPEKLGNVEPQTTVDPDRAMPTVEVDGNFYLGTISLPTINIELPVLSEWSSQNLKTAPCRYTGSVYSDDMILCAHNYKTHFGRLSSLTTGDTVTFTDADGVVWNYTVVQLETVDQYEIDDMTAGDWDLTLFTCTLGGAQRVTVRCMRQV